MPLTLPRATLRDIIRNLLTDDENYRRLVVNAINEVFLHDAFSFLREVARAKSGQKSIDDDWYRRHFLRDELQKGDIATSAGINVKTVTNIRQSATKSIVLEESILHYDRINQIIGDLVDQSTGDDFGVCLKLEDNGNSVELTLTETMIVLSALAAKRAALRGGAWSAVGKQIEKPLMETLCRVFGVAREHYRAHSESESDGRVAREVDFYLVGGDGEEARCEVKLMGRGNPESADSTFSRRSKVFVADKLSGTNKRQLDEWKILWVELHASDRFARFEAVLRELQIPLCRNSADIDGRVVSDSIAAALRGE